MKFCWLLLGLIVACIWATASAQVLFPISNFGGPRQVYSGPGDIVSGASAWWGLRAYTKAIANAGTQKLVNIRNTATSETCDVIVAHNGGFGNVANCSGSSSGDTVSVFCAESSGSCTITEAYDQTGNGFNVTQSTTSKQPALTLNCLNSLPCMAYTASSSQTLNNTSWSTVNNPSTVSTVSLGSSSTSHYAIIASASSETNELAFHLSGSANSIGTSCGGNSFTATSSDGATHALQAVFSGASSVINVDGTETTGTICSSGEASFSGNLGVGSYTSGDYINGDLFEVGLWPSAISSTNRTALCHNQHLYWGTATVC